MPSPAWSRRQKVLAGGTFALLILAVVGAGVWESLARVDLDFSASANLPPLDLDKHADWNDLLARYVDAHGRVDYAGWKESTEDRQKLHAYLARGAQVDPTRDLTDRATALAYWINLYNALTIEGILREYPTSSILAHVRPLGYNIWRDLRLEIGGKGHSLEDIEHGILRPMGEPRIHFAIVCASVGCPRLRNEAYLPSRLEEQLNSNARHFFARNDTFQWSPGNWTLYLSPILQWFADDFGANDAERIATIGPFLADDQDRRVLTSTKVRVRHLDYDWRLNGR